MENSNRKTIAEICDENGTDREGGNLVKNKQSAKNDGS